MSHAQLTDVVRELVVQAFTSLGIAEPHRFRETILLHGGHYCGRRFDTDGAHAVWFLEEDQVKIIAGDGRVAQVLNPEEAAAHGKRLAA